MLIVPDTNLLLRITQPKYLQYLTAVRAAKALQNQGNVLVLLPQTLYEFWVVSTRPATSANGMGLTPTQTRRKLRVLLSRFALQPDTPDLPLLWMALCQRYQVSGVKAHDARLVAAMQAHGIKHILTFNFSDFTRYRRITALDPAQVAVGR